MKLTDLQEAQYAGDHPIVAELKQALENDKPVDVVVSGEMSRTAVEGIHKAFGQPTQQHDEEGMNQSYVWDLPGNRLQVIIQGERTIIELFAFGEDKKRKSAPLMRRMQRRQVR